MIDKQDAASPEGQVQLLLANWSEASHSASWSQSAPLHNVGGETPVLPTSRSSASVKRDDNVLRSVL